MSHRNLFLVLFAMVVAALPGCGGSGNGFDSSDPNGAFSMSLTPNTDGDSLGQVAIEIQASNGVIESGFALLVGNGFDRFTTQDIEGTAQDGRILANIHVKGLVLQLDAEFNGIRWGGVYRMFDGAKVVQSGELNISRTDGTANLNGDWSGEVDFGGKTESVELTFEQKGNSILAEGTINGKFHVTLDIGTVVGSTVYFYAQPEIAGYVFFGNVGSSGNRMTGKGTNGKPFTFVLEKAAG